MTTCPRVSLSRVGILGLAVALWPEVADAFDEGRNARALGMAIDEGCNRYAVGSALWAEWRAGWRAKDQEFTRGFDL